jgi:hypothetical protein
LSQEAFDSDWIIPKNPYSSEPLNALVSLKKRDNQPERTTMLLGKRFTIQTESE